MAISTEEQAHHHASVDWNGGDESSVMQLQQCTCQSMGGRFHMMCRLEETHSDVKENINTSASDVGAKTQEDAGLQQPAEGKSGLSKPLFWVDLEMTGSFLALSSNLQSCNAHKDHAAPPCI